MLSAFAQDITNVALFRGMCSGRKPFFGILKRFTDAELQQALERARLALEDALDVSLQAESMMDSTLLVWCYHRAWNELVPKRQRVAIADKPRRSSRDRVFL